MMKEDMDVPFEGFTYTFPADEIVTVDDKVYEYVATTWPLSFAIGQKLDKMTPVKEAKKVKTKSFFAKRNVEDLGTEDMNIQSPMGETPTFGGVDQLPKSGTTDADGVSWYGDGVQIENPKGE